MTRNLLLIALALFVVGPACSAVAGDLPTDVPGAERYRLVFSDEFTSPASIGATPTEAPDAKWYRAFFFGYPETSPHSVRIEGGVLQMQSEDGTSVNLGTAAPTNNRAGWGGRVFRNGAYWEARIALGPDVAGSRSVNWPAFWTMAVEHMAQKGAARWPGQEADFMRFIESDIFEYNPEWQSGAYYTTMHEWYGRWESCRRGEWCHLSNATDSRRMIRMWPATEFQEFHVYGQLWVPATEESLGYIQNYLDGRPVGVRIEWELGEPEPPARGRKLFNVIDRQGLVLILTSGAQRMSVDWVRVWQIPSGRVERR